MSIYGHGPSAREQMINDRSEQGAKPRDIANEAGLSEAYVRQVIQALVAPTDGQWQRAAISGSTRLLAALRLHHPERCRLHHRRGAA